MTQLCIVIKGPSYEDASYQISQAQKYAEIVELRLDLFSQLDIEALKQLRLTFPIPMIFTLRSKLQGGNYLKSEENRLVDIRKIVTLKPEFLDVEYTVPAAFICEITSHYPDSKLILSFHDHEKTPDDIEKIFQDMSEIPAELYKIAVTANNAIDALRLMCWAKKRNTKLIAISMGLHGQISRILAPMIGNPITYATIDDEHNTAPGQLAAHILLDRYRFRTINASTSIYALIGDPVDQSISDQTHNHFFATNNYNARYVKIQVNPSELAECLQLAKLLPLSGLSVTMPLKECILPYVDYIDHEAESIGAINTLILEKGNWIGFNTDGIGALNAIEKELQVEGKHIVIIGAGGAAKSIAYEAVKRGASVTIINRDQKKAQQIASQLNCVAKGLSQMSECAQEGYDILINCTPIEMPIAADDILPHSYVMDIKIKKSQLLEYALKKNCPVIYGYQMFMEQARGQFNIWFKPMITS